VAPRAMAEWHAAALVACRPHIGPSYGRKVRATREAPDCLGADWRVPRSFASTPLTLFRGSDRLSRSRRFFLPAREGVCQGSSEASF